MEARNRPLKDWYGKIQRGEIKLPRFQRYEAWDRQRIASLVETVVHDLPLGITLTLEVGDKEQFISRYLETTAPREGQRVLEHLLDGQQRLTALWRVFHNNYDWEKYFIYLQEFDNYDKDREQTDLTVYFRGRYLKNGEKYPIWCDDPAQCLQRGYIPTDLLKPEEMQKEIDEWVQKAATSREFGESKDELKKYYDFQKRISDSIKDLRSVIANYNLPYLSLPAETDKSIALDVFIKMNTNSKPLSQYDVIVAEVESVMGSSLHDLHDSLDKKHPDIGKYGDLSDMLLNTSALLQGSLPNQRGAWDMDKTIMVRKWPVMEVGLFRMAEFLCSEGIYDRERLPTNAVLAVIAALYEHIPESGDKRGKDELLLKKYLWFSFFTDRYENSAATHAFSDFIAMKRIITGEKKENGSLYSVSDVPVFADHKLVEKEELLDAEWPKRWTIRGRAILAVVCRLGAFDFSTGEHLSKSNISSRHYHHIYPDALLKEAGVDSYTALNCALISDRTNMAIGRKDPLQYLKDRYEWTTQDIVKDRLESHLVPIPELANGGYEGLSDREKKEKIKKDFELFLKRRAELIMTAVKSLVEGKQISAATIFKDGKTGNGENS
ncbi:MAG: DUF262 domain-containing protein [Spirochaetales bacterium]|nr:DUF262 domain-containing protein [Spirochaetales bacterium]